jgi:putative FmdB family regulatory protein
MPIYEYACRGCGAKFEQLVRSMSGREKFDCPKCGSKQTARALSVFAVGAEGAKPSSSAPSDMPMCGRCGGPGPCAME